MCFLWCFIPTIEHYRSPFYFSTFQSIELIENLKFMSIKTADDLIRTSDRRLYQLCHNLCRVISRPLLLYFRLFDTVDCILVTKRLPLTGFELQTSGVGCYRSTNWATTIALPRNLGFKTWNIGQHFSSAKKNEATNVKKVSIWYLEQFKSVTRLSRSRSAKNVQVCQIKGKQLLTKRIAKSFKVCQT